MAIYKSNAAAAKARMAKRARRQRFLKENKKRILLISLAVVLLLLLAFLTPWGPDYYYAKIQARKMESSTTVAPGVIHDLYKLGVFYQYTMRSGDALRIYNEIGNLYYGFNITDYGTDPDRNFEKRMDLEVQVNRGEIPGPPFKIASSDLRYIGYTLYRVGEIIQHDRSKQFTYNIYKDLYLEEFLEEHPEDADEDVTFAVRGFYERFLGYR